MDTQLLVLLGFIGSVLGAPIGGKSDLKIVCGKSDITAIL